MDSSKQWGTMPTKETAAGSSPHSFDAFSEKKDIRGNPPSTNLRIKLLRWLFLLVLILVFCSWMHNGFAVLSNDRFPWTNKLASYDGVIIKCAYSGLRDLPAKQYIPPKLNKSITGTPLRVAGITYEKGIGTYSPSKIVFDLAGNIKNFSCLVGMDVTADDSGIAVFRVFADGDMLFESPPMWRGMDPQPVEIEVSNKRSLCLEVENSENVGSADWLNIRMTRE